MELVLRRAKDRVKAKVKGRTKDRTKDRAKAKGKARMQNKARVKSKVRVREHSRLSNRMASLKSSNHPLIPREARAAEYLMSSMPLHRVVPMLIKVRLTIPKNFLQLWREFLVGGSMAGTAKPSTGPKLDRSGFGRLIEDQRKRRFIKWISGKSL